MSEDKEMPARIWVDESLGMIGYINEAPPPESDFKYEYMSADFVAAKVREAKEEGLKDAIAAIAVLPTQGTMNYRRGYEEGVRDALRTLEVERAAESREGGDDG